MADNVPVTTGSGISIGADEISAVKYQRIKLIHGADGTNDGDVASGNPLPVTGSTSVVNTVTITGSTTIVGTPTITGSVSVVNEATVALSAVDNAVLDTIDTVLDNIKIDTEAIETAVEGTLAVTGSVVIVNDVTITGSTSVVNTVTITGSTTIASMPAITGSVAVVNEPVVALSAVDNAVLDTIDTVLDNIKIDTEAIETAVEGTLAVTGSVVIVNDVTITGSTSVVNTVTITGSTTLVNIKLPSAGDSSITATTVGTSILIPSTASNSIYVTDIMVSNGVAAGSVYLGEHLGVTAPTTVDIKINEVFLAVNGGFVWSLTNPIKLTASRNLTITAVSCTTMTATATYYVAA